MTDAAGTLLALAALAASLLAPGALLVRLAGLGATPLERFGLAVALGRIALGLVTLVLASAGALAVLPWLAAAASVAWIVLALRDRQNPARVPRSPATPEGWRWALAPFAAAILLGALVVFRSGVVEPGGDLVFRGKDAANDPLFYAATSAQLAARGLPLHNPFASGFPMVGHALFFGALTGAGAIATALAAAFGGAAAPTGPLGGSTALAEAARFGLLFRALPLLDLASLGLAAFAVARALGGSARAAAFSGVLVLLGGEAFALVRAGALGLGVEARDILGWAFFGPLLLPVNPVTAAMQTLFAACFLLARLPGAGTAAAVVAGILVGASAEQKLFAFAAALPALVLAALLAAPPRVARHARLAALAALVAGLPSVAEKLVFARQLGERFTVGFAACPGCLPRYLVDTTFGSGDFSFRIFESFSLASLLEPRLLAASLGASLLFLVVVLGARAMAVPELLRGCADADPGRSFAWRVLGFAAAGGFGLTLVVAAGPHYLNGGQFAWPALFALALALGLAVDRWLRAGRRALAGLALGLALASPALTLVRMGAGAPVLSRVGPDERTLLHALAVRVAPDEVVLEPSWLAQPDHPAATTWLAGRGVYLSTDGAAAYLPSWERLFRADVLRRVYQSPDRASALRAVEASRARWVLAPRGHALAFDPGPALEAVFTNEAGTLYRVRLSSDPSP